MALHLCFLCNEYPPEPHGGVGSLVQALGRALVARGHDVTVLGVSASRPGVEDDEGVRVVRLPHARLRGTGFVVHGRRLRRALAQVHRERPVDVVEGQEGALAVLPRRRPYRTVIRMNGGHHFFATTLGRAPRPWRSWIERRSFRRADHLCAVSAYVGETTRSLLHLGDRPITVLPNAVDTERFRPSAVDGDPNRIAFAGTLCEKKGIRQLLEAFPAVLARHPDAQLDVAGRDWVDEDGSFRARLEAALDPDTAAHVHFLGPVDHEALPDVLARASVCAFPSHMEAMPLAWLEGLAVGRPVLAGDIGPAPEVIEDGVSGVLCDPFDPAAIADALNALLDDGARRAALGREARRRAESEFSIRVMVERNEAFFSACATAAPGSPVRVPTPG